MTTNQDSNQQWYEDSDNVALVARYMAEHYESAGEVAYMVEKPHKYVEMFLAAVNDLEPHQQVDVVGYEQALEEAADEYIEEDIFRGER